MSTLTAFTPLQWKNGIDPQNKSSFQTFMKQLADWANSLQQQVQALVLSQTTTKGIALGTVSANQTFDCTGANAVVLSVVANVNPFTLTLTNLLAGVPVWVVFQNNIASGVLIIAASSPLAVPYTVTAIGDAVTFPMATGFTAAASPTLYTFFGNAVGSNLWLALT